MYGVEPVGVVSCKDEKIVEAVNNKIKNANLCDRMITDLVSGANYAIDVFGKYDDGLKDACFA